MHLNMLPLQHRRQQMITRRLRQWSVVWGVSLVLVLILGWFQAAECRYLTATVDVLEAKQERGKDLQAKLRNVRQELQLIEQQEGVAFELSQPRPMLTLFGIISQAARQCDGSVSVRRVSWDAGEGGGKQSKNPLQRHTLTLQGVGLDNLAVARFAAELRANEIFQDVKLKSTGEEVINGHLARIYELECTAY